MLFLAALAVLPAIPFVLLKSEQAQREFGVNQPKPDPQPSRDDVKRLG